MEIPVPSQLSACERLLQSERNQWRELSQKLRTRSWRLGGGERVRAVSLHDYWTGYQQASRIVCRSGLFRADLPPGARWGKVAISALITGKKLDGTPYAPKTIGGYLFGVYMVLCVIEPDKDYRHILTAHRRIPRDSMRPKTIIEPEKLIELGIAEMQRAQAHIITRSPEGRLPKHAATDVMQAAVRFRTGFQICWLAILALRLANLAMTEIGNGRNLFEVDAWWLLYDRRVMKNKKGYDRAFPQELVPWLKIHQDLIRPILCLGRYTGDRLWVSSRGAPLSRQSIRRMVKKMTQRAFGKPITPHWFRDCVATAIAKMHPADIKRASWVLANDPDTVNFTYNHAGKGPARRAVAERLESLRRAGHLPRHR